MTKEFTTEEKQNLMASLEQAYTDERDFVNQLLGQVQMADVFAKFSATVAISQLAYIKENKLYRALKSKKSSNGCELLTGTWDEFCELIGTSSRKVDTDIQNLRTFGEEALESMSRMGIDYRELRQFRKLPDDQKTALIEIAKQGDKESFIELAEEVIAKHAKEKDALQKQLADAQADGEAKTKVIADKDKKINELSTAFEKKKLQLESLPPEQAALELFQNTWGEVSGDLLAAVHYARQTVEQAVENENLPYTFRQKLTLDIVETRDILNELLDLLPSDTEPVDTSWLKGEQV